jgi:hypothetical protein
LHEGLLRPHAARGSQPNQPIEEEIAPGLTKWRVLARFQVRTVEGELLSGAMFSLGFSPRFTALGHSAQCSACGRLHSVHAGDGRAGYYPLVTGAMRRDALEAIPRAAAKSSYTSAVGLV